MSQRSGMSLEHRDSMGYMSGYKHIHIVKAPSLLENESQFNQMNDSKRIGGFFSGCNLRHTNSIRGDHLSYIR